MTADVTLRAVCDDDLPIFFEQQLDPTANHMVAFTRRDPTDRDAFEAHWKKIRADATVTVRTIVFDEHAAGYVSSFDDSGKREVCYWIGKDYWGKGIATAALAELLTEVDLRPLYGVVAKDNLGSIRVLARCGFDVIGHQRSFAKSRGEEIDEVLMKLE